MSIKTLFVYNSPKLFEILDEIKTYLNMEVYQVDKKSLKKTHLDESENYMFVSSNPSKEIEANLLVIDSQKKNFKVNRTNKFELFEN